MSIAKQHPELVLQCGYLKDFEGVQPFGLGGVVKSGTSHEERHDIEAIITYHTPYSINGREVVVSFGLGKEVATNTILSWPFIQAIAGSILTESNTFVSGKLGEVLRMESIVPLRAETAPTVPKAVSKTFAAFPPSFDKAAVAFRMSELQQAIAEAAGDLVAIDETRATYPDPAPGFGQ